MSCLTKACRYLADDCVKEWRLIKASEWNNSTAARVLRLSEWVLIWRWLILCNGTDFRYEIRQIHQIQRPTDYDQTNQHPPKKNRRKGLVVTKAGSCCNFWTMDAVMMVVLSKLDNIPHPKRRNEGHRRLPSLEKMFSLLFMGLGSSLMNHLVPLREKKSEGNIHPVTFNRFFFLSKCCLWAPDGHVKHILWMYETLSSRLLQNMTWTELKKYLSQQISVGLLFEVVIIMLIKSHQMDP